MYYRNRLYYKYDEEWIIGKSKVDVEKRYGKFDRKDVDGRYGYLIPYDIFADIIFSYDYSIDGSETYYFIDFDESDNAEHIFVFTLP